MLYSWARHLTSLLSGKPEEMLWGGGGEGPCNGPEFHPGGSGNTPICFMLHGDLDKL